MSDPLRLTINLAFLVVVAWALYRHLRAPSGRSMRAAHPVAWTVLLVVLALVLGDIVRDTYGHVSDMRAGDPTRVST